MATVLRSPARVLFTFIRCLATKSLQSRGNLGYFVVCATRFAKQKVLSIYKKLHRTAVSVFNGDTVALTAARNKINEEFRKHLTVQEPAKLEELLTVANDAEVALRTTVFQAEVTKPGVFKVRITKDHLRDNAVAQPKKDRRKKSDETPS